MKFMSRTWKELLRDPLNIAFGLGFPLVVLFLLSAIQANIPVSLFEIDHLIPGIVVFGLSFITLFAAQLISKDRTTSFLTRLFASPMKAENYIFGYTIPVFPIAVLQIFICFIAAVCLGLKVNANMLLAIAVEIPAVILFIGLGLLCGSVFTDKQVGGICGAVLTN